MTPEILARWRPAGSTTTALSVHDERGTRSTASNPVIRVIEDATRFYLEAYPRQRPRLSWRICTTRWPRRSRWIRN